jgi:hypothetical protein
MNGSAQDHDDDRQDKERNEGENLASLDRRDGGPNKQQADQNDTQKNDDSDCVVGQCLFPSEMRRRWFLAYTGRPSVYPVKNYPWTI